MSAIKLVLVTIGASVTLSTHIVSSVGQQTTVADLPNGWINRGVMACALIPPARVQWDVVLLWDLIDSLWYAVESACTARGVLKANARDEKEGGDEGEAAAAAEVGAFHQSSQVSTKNARTAV
jgi:hypothetical protein